MYGVFDMNQRRGLSRRGFLLGAASSAAAFPYVVASAALGKAGGVAASERITLGCIGVGDHGTKVNLKNFLGNSDAQVVAVCDVDEGRRDNAKGMVNARYSNGGCAAYTDFREIIEREDIDAVVISTPDHWHALMSVMAAKTGKDVFCEKPTLTVEEGRIVSDTIRRYDRVFQTASGVRARGTYHRMCELARNGYLGKVHTLRVVLPSGPHRPGDPTPMPVPKDLQYDLWLGPAPWAPYTKDRLHYHWRWILDYSGGQLTDWGAHLVGIAQWVNNTDDTCPVEVKGKGVFCKGGLYNTAREYEIEYKYSSGVRLIVTSGQPGVQIEGDKGWIGALGTNRKGLDAKPKSLLETVLGPGDERVYTCAAGEQRNFLDCVKSRKKCFYPEEAGHRTFTTTHIGNISMMLGKKLKWDPAAERFTNDDDANRMLSRAMRSPWRL